MRKLCKMSSEENQCPFFIYRCFFFLMNFIQKEVFATFEENIVKNSRQMKKFASSFELEQIFKWKLHIIYMEFVNEDITKQTKIISD